LGRLGLKVTSRTKTIKVLCQIKAVHKKTADIGFFLHPIAIFLHSLANIDIDLPKDTLEKCQFILGEDRSYDIFSPILCPPPLGFINICSHIQSHLAPLLPI
jgi:hypothetical protein